jgi:hypothetical protein
MLLNTARFVYHYTKASTALEFILDSMTLRLSTLPDTNDPTEGHEWGFVLVGNDPAGSALDTFKSVAEAMRVGHKLVCFSRDVPGMEQAEDYFTPSDAIATRGYARDRMWAQYADGHRGVCLFFDREILEENFKTALSSKGFLRAAPVTYTNWSEELYKAREIVLKDMEHIGSKEYLRQHREKYADELYFLKRTDWASEWEYRLLLLANDPSVPHEFIPIRRALAGICVGHRFSAGYRPSIAAVCDRENIPAYRLVYLQQPVIGPYYFPQKKPPEAAEAKESAGDKRAEAGQPAPATSAATPETAEPSS